MTVKELKEAIANLPDDGEVYVQRIEDFYFEENNWSVKLMKGEQWHYLDKWNKDVESGKYLDREQYPDMEPKILKKISDEEMEQSMEQYITTWCCINYDGKNLYVTSHY